jgi:hypothetical protein
MFKRTLVAVAICVALASPVWAFCGLPNWGSDDTCAGPFQRKPIQQIIAWCRAHVAKDDVTACVLDASREQVQPPRPEPLPWPAVPSAHCITQQNGIWFSTPCPH